MSNEIDSKQTLVSDSYTNADLQASFDEEEGLSVLDLLLVFSKKKALILVLAILGGLLATAYAFLTPPTYTATAVIMPPQQQSSSAAALLGQLGGIAGFAGQNLGLKNPSDPYVGILSSRTVADQLIAQFGLQKVYKKKNLTETRERLANVTRFNPAKYALIHISVEDKDSKRAADLANAYVDQLQEQNRRLAVTEASQRRLFFERQLKIEKDHLVEAEAAFKRMQEQKGIIHVSSQVEAVIASMTKLRAELAAREVNLQRLKAGATRQNPEVQRQEIELKALRDQIQKIESTGEKKSAGDTFMPTTMMPSAGLEYARRLREVKYQETLFELLAKQYEVARIDEAKEAPIIQVVDLAVIPDKKTAPARSLYLISGFLLGGGLGILLTLIGNYAQNPLRVEKLAALKKSLWMSRKA